MKRSLALVTAQKKYYMKNREAIHKKIAQTARNKYGDADREKKREYYIEKKNFERLADNYAGSLSKLFRGL
tara:strand:+ start:3106 stop:3318 length:213 start_codon:yes stop_codon:yes gene_type:complete